MQLPNAWAHVPLPDGLSDAVEREYASHTVYPPRKQLFAALEKTPPSRVRAVILGQDPYHEPGQAMGLAFSVPNGTKLPPSLRNIFRERSDDLGLPLRENGDLSDWAEQGVLLLNCALTVRSGEANSHRSLGWEPLVDDLLRSLADQPAPICAVLWGSFAAQKAPLFQSVHPRLILTAPHPSPLSAYRGFFGSKPFSQINAFLRSHGEPAIRW